MTYTISQVGRRFGLSRSTLLYYDRIGLVSPRGRSQANYRVYSGKDLTRMEEVAQLRNAGISLKEIRKILRTKSSVRMNALGKRLALINQEINALRGQQRLLLQLLGNQDLFGSTCVVSKEQWIGFLVKAGLDEEGMKRWHQEFEKTLPQAHQDFLESLGLSKNEVALIRKHSRLG